MVNRVYVGAKFPGSSRVYTYHAENVDVSVGQTAKVETSRGLATVEIVSVSNDAPLFDTKPIVSVVALGDEAAVASEEAAE